MWEIAVNKEALSHVIKTVFGLFEKGQLAFFRRRFVRDVGRGQVFMKVTQKLY